ncbi:MAG: PLP-dependent aspartate aminotransferase family protein [Bacillota bacterium]|nr:PLP-dependent aspartate aminotransferase family protein [Bacillota bacterium]MDW7683276.1 PLP-dependent aspartate aminotransferase family protein [Bacillota bacterium]
MKNRIFGTGEGHGRALATRIVQSGVRFDQATGAVSVPIYQSATFRHPLPGESTGFDYTRIGNPTRQALEEAFAALDQAAGAFAFSSGMAAITAVAFLFESGDHLILGEEIYGGTYRLMDWILAKFGLTVSYVDTADPVAVEQAIRTETRVVFLETPSNPLLRLTDIAAIARLCKKRRILTIVDNTLLTPYLQRPLALGADIAVYSATKYLGGHNDLLAGLVTVANEKLAQDLAVIQQGAGFVLAPQDSWLLLRGLKTLAVRMDRQQENAQALAAWLREHPQVERVYYPGLDGNQEIIQSDGTGAMLSFSVKDAKLAGRVTERLQLITFAESLGGVESLITYPYLQTHADMPAEVRSRLGIHDRLLRLSVGIEHLSDLQADLRAALK